MSKFQRMQQVLFAHRRLAVLLVIYLVLAVTYSVVTPIGRGADEWAHYWYAQFIAQNRRLPASPAEREAAGYKSDWPPLYHLLTAGVTAWVDTQGPPAFKYRADEVRRQLIPAQGSEAILHTLDEQFPWQQEVLVWHLGRFLSIAFSALTLLLTYRLTLELFSRRGAGRSVAPYRLPFDPQTLALAAVAVLVFNPRFLFTGMLFNYDSLTLLLASLFLWLSIRIAKGYYPRWGFWLLGAIAGLALIAKYLAAPLVLVIIVIAWRSPSTSSGTGAGAQGSREAEEAITQQALRTTHYAVRSTQHFNKSLAQAGLAFLLVTSWWFAYLFINFNEIDAYGPVLGTLAPLLRGDGSDRTVEELFARFSGGQVPPPPHIDRPAHTPWQIIAELPATFWGNPVMRPYPLNWFIWAITLTTLLAAIGLGLFWWGVKGNRFWLNLLLLYCALPLPFMIIRLFGARDALEAVQGRHILFLAGPAFSILLVLGIWSVARVMANIIRVLPQVSGAAPHLARPILMDFVILLATGAMAQLVFMMDVYPPPLPVQTTPYAAQANTPIPAITLPGGAKLIDYQLSSTTTPYSLLPTSYSLKITLIWQGGESPAPADYQTGLALVDAQGEPRSGWLGYQTQARYPTRAWEAGDTIFDAGYLSLTGLPSGDYQIQLRILEEGEPITGWQTLTTYTLPARQPAAGGWTLWQNGQPANRLPQFQERETAQFTTHLSLLTSDQLLGPNGLVYSSVDSGPTWANFIIAPHWPAGEYHLAGVEDSPVLRVAKSSRNFELPAIPQPLEASFAGKIKLLGYHLPPMGRRVEPGQRLPVTLYWQGQEWLGEELVIFTRLLDNQQVVWGGYDRLPQENYSPLLWAPGQVITDGFTVPVRAGAPPGVYMLSLGWYRRVGGQAESLPLVDPQTGQPTGQTAITIGPIKVGGPPDGVTVESASPATPVNVALGDEIKLTGYDIAIDHDEPAQNRKSKTCAERSRSIQNLKLTLYWQALRQPQTDYTVFAHVRNQAGEIMAQKDTPPAGGAYPTGLWDPGEIIKDRLTIPLPELPPGRYELVVGMYDFSSGARLPVAGSPDGSIPVQTFEVEP